MGMFRLILLAAVLHGGDTTSCSDSFDCTEECGLHCMSECEVQTPEQAAAIREAQECRWRFALAATQPQECIDAGECETPVPCKEPADYLTSCFLECEADCETDSCSEADREAASCSE